MNMKFVAFILALGLVCVISNSASAIPVTDGLAAWWEFDSSNGGNQDSSVNNRDLMFRPNPNATASAAPTVVSGGVGGGTALQMPAFTTDTRLPSWFYPIAGGDAILPDVPGAEPLDLSGPFGLQAWLKFDSFSPGVEQQLLGKTSDMGTSHWQGWRITHLRNSVGEDSIKFTAKTSTGGFGFGEYPLSLATDQWYQLVITASTSGPLLQYQMYLNGVMVEVAGAGSVGGVEFPFMLGDFFMSWGGVSDIRGEPFAGSFDKVAFWNRALTSDDVNMLYNGGSGYTITTAVPEPSSIALLATGGVMIALWRRKRQD